VPRMHVAASRREVLELGQVGRPVAGVAEPLGVSEQTICHRRTQNPVDLWLQPGVAVAESAERAPARQRDPSPKPTWGSLGKGPLNA